MHICIQHDDVNKKLFNKSIMNFEFCGFKIIHWFVPKPDSSVCTHNQWRLSLKFKFVRFLNFLPIHKTQAEIEKKKKRNERNITRTTQTWFKAKTIKYNISVFYLLLLLLQSSSSSSASLLLLVLFFIMRAMSIEYISTAHFNMCIR